ncbi:anti-sigma factor domain-containing protein [Saccharibacillus kuerlensis]|uniref:Regulator of SigK n=1 Tax=Saccharibacillus kuerlensis TaxID=459527 RepID=A0ABQ2L2Q9_9BACL|nr:anti-sigma factor [Saccharibacillus kuerlensis]GGN99048.1 hypothetical protein GCM10010969_18870 [Saccharibacillus kuerlensis]
MNERKESMMDWAELYVLGGLNEAETAEYEAYLQHNAEEQRRVAELRDTVGMLALAAKPAAPPAGMKGRILGNILGTGTVSNSDRTETVVEQTDADVRSSSRHEDRTRSEHETEIQLEQARQGIEAGEARRAAEVRTGSGSLLAADVSGKAQHAKEQKTNAPQAPEQEIPSVGIDERAGRKNVQTDPVEEAQTSRKAARARSGRSLWAGAAAIMAAAAVLLGIYSAQLRGELNDMRTNLTAMEQRTSDMERQLAMSTQPAVGAQVARTVPLVGSENAPQASGMAAMVQDDTGTRLVVQAEDLPALSGSEAYQVWLIKDGQPINAGTFQSGSGNGALTYTMQPDDYDMVAITLEPDAQGDQPRGQMLLTAALNG